MRSTVRRFGFLSGVVVVLAGVGSLVGGEGIASGALIRVDFEGVVSDTPPAALAGVFTNAAVSGSIIYDDAVAPRAGATVDSSVFDSVVSASLNVPGASTVLTTGEVQEDNFVSASLGLTDRLAFLARAADASEELAFTGSVLSSFGLRFDDSTNAAISTTAVQPSSVSLGDFTSARFLLFFTDPTTGGLSTVLTGPLSVVTSSVVPEPAALGLVPAVLATLGRRRSR